MRLTKEEKFLIRESRIKKEQGSDFNKAFNKGVEAAAGRAEDWATMCEIVLEDETYMAACKDLAVSIRGLKI